MLDVVDNLGRALEASKETYEEKNNDLYEGVKMTQSALVKTLERNNITKIPAEIGSKFDFNVHEAIVQVDDPSKPGNSIAFTCQDGFKIGSRVLRATKVGVVKANEKSN